MRVSYSGGKDDGYERVWLPDTLRRTDVSLDAVSGWPHLYSDGRFVTVLFALPW